MLRWLADEQYGEDAGRLRVEEEVEAASEDEDTDDLDKRVLHDIFSPPPPLLSLHPRTFRHVAFSHPPAPPYCNHRIYACPSLLPPRPVSSSSSSSGWVKVNTMWSHSQEYKMSLAARGSEIHSTCLPGAMCQHTGREKKRKCKDGLR